MIKPPADLFNLVKSESMTQPVLQESPSKNASIAHNPTENIPTRNGVYKGKGEYAPPAHEEKNLSIELRAAMGLPAEDN